MLRAGLRKDFWFEALHTSCYIINMCPSRAIELKSPMELWTYHKIDYNNHKCFGCATYSHIKEDKMSKRALKCVFLGCHEGVKGYKFYYLEEGR